MSEYWTRERLAEVVEQLSKVRGRRAYVARALAGSLRVNDAGELVCSAGAITLRLIKRTPDHMDGWHVFTNGRFCEAIVGFGATAADALSWSARRSKIVEAALLDAHGTAPHADPDAYPC